MTASLSVTVAAFLLALATTCKAATPASNCTSQTFSNNKTFSSCTDLPHLQASLFWTYNPTNSTASLAFLAPPSKPTGWIAWGINPTSTGMVGSQSLIAFQYKNGSINVQTYNITAYGPVHPSPISINTSNLEAEFQGGVISIFATVELPKNGTKLNQVWQVGSSVSAGLPDKHAFGKENLLAMGEWDLLKGETVVKSGNAGNSSESSGKVGGGANSTTAAAPSSSPSAAISSTALISGRFWKGLMVLVFSFGFLYMEL